MRENEDVSPATRAKLIEFFDDQQKLFLLKLELAVIVDVGAHFVKATYTLEGDGLLALICYDRVNVPDPMFCNALYTKYIIQIHALKNHQLTGFITLTATGI